MKMNIDEMISDMLPELIELRHDLHRIPEIAGMEYKTCKRIREYLSDIPELETAPPFLQTDTVSMLYGRSEGKTSP